jgi:hypothetical protein
MRGQIADQSFKGAIAALVLYVAVKLGADSELVLILTPIITGGLAMLSKKVGDPDLASFLQEPCDQ